MVSLRRLLPVLGGVALLRIAAIRAESNEDSANATSGISGNGIPGTTQTDNGYDTETGTDPMCWRSYGDIHAPNSTTRTTAAAAATFSNYLLTGFELGPNRSVELLRACPGNGANDIRGYAPPEKVQGQRLRTGQWYNYSARVRLDLASLGGTEFVADNGTNQVSVQILLCLLGESGFCSPFIHDEANDRLARLGNTTPVKIGDSHGGSHIHSPRVFKQLDPDPNKTQYEFETVVPMLAHVPGNYFAIVAVQMFLAQNGTNRSSSSAAKLNGTITRYDMSNKLDKFFLLTYQEPPTTLEVEPAILYLSYVGIAVVSSVIVFLLFHTVKHRNSKVIQLTQGPFLVLFLVAALAATIGAFLLNPASDTYCQAGFPTVLASLQLVFAVTFGRLWRINAVISPLLMQTLRQEQSWQTRCFKSIRKFVARAQESGSRRKIKLLRRKVTNAKLSAMIAALTLPQVILQVLAVTLQPSALTIEWNSDESTGRYTCSRPQAKDSLTYYGCYVFFLLVVCLLFLAHATRDLPSLLNETRVIFDSTLSSLVVLVLGIGVIAVTQEPTTSPGVEYLVSLICILSLTLNMSWRIIMPKLRMVWRGETILVSKLVSDHARSVRQDDDRVRISGLTNPLGKSGGAGPDFLGAAAGGRSDFAVGGGGGRRHHNASEASGRSDSDVLAADMERFDSDYRFQQASFGNGLTESSQSETDAPAGNGIGNGTTDGADSSGWTSNGPSHAHGRTGLQKIPSQRRSSTSHSIQQIVVARNETPARRLVLRMVDLQEHLHSVNERIMSGLAVSEEEWTKLRKLCRNMGLVFTNEVRFEWEPLATNDPESASLVEMDPQFARLLEEVDEDENVEPDVLSGSQQQRRMRTIMDLVRSMEGVYVSSYNDETGSVEVDI
jgi:7 transmembrane sweet-taste receptor of 3 GCPR